MRIVDALQNAAVLVIALCTVVITGIVIRREFFVQPGAVRKPVEIDAREWHELSAGDLRIGSANAPLTVVEFVDFECPACAAFHRTLKKFVADHPDEVTVVLQHFPLNMHPNALRLARTVECAAQQGRLEAIQDSIFSRQAVMSGLEPKDFAKLVGVGDTVDFSSCVADSTRTRNVMAGIDAAERLGIVGTPTLIMNGRQYRQLVDSAVLRQALETAMRK